MCLAQGPQRSDASEARTCNPSVLSQAQCHCAPCDAGEVRTRNPWVSSQALYHWAPFSKVVATMIFIIVIFLSPLSSLFDHYCIIVEHTIKYLENCTLYTYQLLNVHRLHPINCIVDPYHAEYTSMPHSAASVTHS